MTTSRISRTVLALSVAALITAGCGGSGGDATGDTTLDVTIKGGEVTPTNTQMDARVGEPIVIRVNSDAADELHVHSNPEHSFAISPANGQSFQFTVDVPGRVDVELHHLHTTVVTITVAQ